MFTRPISCLVVAAWLSGCASMFGNTPDYLGEVPQAELVRFESNREFDGYANMLAERIADRYIARNGSGAEDADGEAEAAPATEAAASAGGEASITNTQEAGVDEGGIVKAHGDYLVVLRRGRLFSVRVGGGALEAVSMVNAFPPTQAGSDAWYDEMLIEGDRIVVIGYSYGAQATEVGLFDIDDAGDIRHHATYHLRSHDYYSSRNYASRLVGDKLVFYMPHYLFETQWNGSAVEVEASMPSLRRGSGTFRPVLHGTDVYRPIQATQEPTLHTVVTCDLSAPDLRCRACAVVGPPSRTFYVSESAVYVWVSDESGGDVARNDAPNAVVYRLPLDGSTPGALRTFGAPIDQFSFKEDDDVLNVLVAPTGGGDAMWNPEVASPAGLALLRVPVDRIDTDVATIPRDSYAVLPRPRGYTLQNRFVGSTLLYGTGSSWGYPEPNREDQVYVYPLGSNGVHRVALGHGVDRIEALGDDAMVIGTDGANLNFSSVALDTPALASRYVYRGATQGELRSHGFFYKPDGDQSGVLGLPVQVAGRPGYAHLVEGSAEVAFLRVDHRELSPLGALTAAPQPPIDDQCVASCVDWYGNARPIFYRGRTFALLGYELVEGRVDNGHMREIGRTSFFRSGPRRVVVLQ